ncbi:putative porin [Halosquirtibacter xylanolyticus]|uniref:putative porin n=1 Tax=Halosquirtibacter xylanolyticus TaxID=3374599 RepID=UPI003748AD20|nr:putative porin [Prolixibacteraceae bacterium]
MKLLYVISLFVLVILGTVSTSQGQVNDLTGIEESEEESGHNHPEESDSIKSYIKTWRFNEDFSQKITTEMDTSLTHFHQRRLDQKKNIYVQNTGNLGTAYQSYSFFERDYSVSGFQYLKNYQDYITNPNSVVYYNTTTPYTLLDYSQWWNNKPKGQTTFHVIHTQNITPYLNFGFDYKYNGSDGRYQYQNSTDNSFTFFTNYEGERYSGYLSFSQNKVSQQENGGLRNPNVIHNKDLKPENYIVWMEGSQNVMKEFNISYNHKYDLGKFEKVQYEDGVYEEFVPKITLMHTISYRNDTKSYTETEANPSNGTGSTLDSDYYYGYNPTYYLSDSRTDDFAKESVLSNLLQVKFQEDEDRKYSFSKRVYGGFDIIGEQLPQTEQILTPEGTQSISGVNIKENLYNVYVGGEVAREKGKFWNWSAGGRYYVTGYRSQDLSLYGVMSKPIRTKRDTSFLTLNAEMDLTTPNYYVQKYTSNHYKWDNNFDKTYRLLLHAKYEKPSIHFKVGADMAFINNYVYYGYNVVPEQAASEFSVWSVSLQKDFHFGPFIMENRMIYQKSSSDTYIHIPSFIFRNSTYISGYIYPVLEGQFGVDTYFSTKYYADKYSPSLNQFYLQNDEKIGGYPVCDLFLSLKLKRVRLFVKYAFVNQLLGGIDYFTSPSYPIQPADLSFGASWSFYD